ncbi:DUF2628 domain-containing protein [Mesorhizobium xinjiangense]|uniref:DUF2628 domain-containing protein n=1 Tax=Mesorhizobium xinjiangense TaxID=2678685 RepID=UPI0012ED4C8A|nr:DUF2628 domain-containing protein [Mesorhizobium xinjiangense]
MASYVVMEPPGGQDSADKGVVLVRDGFAWLGFFLPFLWLLWHRLWLEAAIALALALGLGILSEFGSFIVVTPVLSLLVSLYVGLEGPALRLAGMARRGWRQAGVVEADSHADADVRHIVDAVSTDETHQEPAPQAPAPWRGSSRSSGPALGLLGYSGNAR